MPKQKTVKINIEAIEQKIAAQGWSNAYFCENYMKKGRGWISEWKRGSSLPTPKDAATMCLLLHTTPEEILLAEGETAEETAKCQEDIALVRKLLEEMQEAKKAPATEGEGYDDKITRLYTQLPKLSDRQREMILGIVDEMLKNGEA